VFDFLGGQVLNLLTVRRLGGPEAPLPETKRLLPPEIPTTPIARGATAEDQVLLGAAPYAPGPPIPLKPNEPAAPENRVRDVLRRVRDRQRQLGPIPDPLPEVPDPENDGLVGKRLDLYA
jgi:hypothetical protein